MQRSDIEKAIKDATYSISFMELEIVGAELRGFDQSENRKSLAVMKSNRDQFQQALDGLKG